MTGDRWTTGEARFRQSAFTLIEIMMVVAILAIVMAMGLPTIYRAFRKESLRKAVADIEEACRHARAQAIMHGEPTQADLPPPLPGGISLEMLDVNFIEHKEERKARVRFYPNGTCDELTIVLRSDQNEYRKISLECTTGMTTVEVIR